MNSRRILHTAFRIFVLTMLILVTFQVSTVSAKDLSKDKPKHTAKAILKNKETNEKVELPVEIVEHENDKGVAVTYVVNVALSLIPEEHYIYDPTGGMGAKLTVTQYYSETWIPNHKVAIDRTNARWDKYDNTYTISNAKVGSTVWAADPYMNKTEISTVGTPSNGATYVQTPSWKGIFVVINDFAYQESLANSDIRRGSGTIYSFNLCVAQGGGAIITCE